MSVESSRVVTAVPRGRSRTREMSYGSDVLPRSSDKRDARSRFTAQQPLAFDGRHEPRRLFVYGADVVARQQAGPRGGRAVSNGDDLEVVLARDLDPQPSLGERLAGLDPEDVLSRQICAVAVQAAGQSPQGAVHHVLELRLLDVVLRDEGDHVLEDPEMAVHISRCHRLAQKAAHQREGDDRTRHEDDAETHS